MRTIDKILLITLIILAWFAFSVVTGQPNVY